MYVLHIYNAIYLTGNGSRRRCWAHLGSSHPFHTPPQQCHYLGICISSCFAWVYSEIICSFYCMPGISNHPITKSMLNFICPLCCYRTSYVFYYECTGALAIIHIIWCIYWQIWYNMETTTTEDVVEEYVQHCSYNNMTLTGTSSTTFGSECSILHKQFLMLPSPD